MSKIEDFYSELKQKSKGLIGFMALAIVAASTRDYVLNQQEKAEKQGNSPVVEKLEKVEKVLLATTIASGVVAGLNLGNIYKKGWGLKK